MTTAEEVRIRSEKRTNEGFATWLNKAETRLIISTIPPTENKETLTVLLRSAFESGFACGSSEVLGSIIESMLKKESPQR